MSARLDAATLAQVRAARPDVSTWLSANAGSGKTRVLTDRVALLLLAGAAPQGILCLTYTKAAAGEMQNRLFERLGEWAMLDDDALLAQLSQLSEQGLARVEDLPKARRLFARAIETPGGLKIQTIHSFCASLLRQFPIEARVSPGFREIDDRMAAQIQARVLDQIALSDTQAFDGLQRIIGGRSVADFAGVIAAERRAFFEPLDPAVLAKCLGVEPGLTVEEVVSGPAHLLTDALLDGLSEALLLPKKREHQGALLRAYRDNPQDLLAFEAACGVALTKSHTIHRHYLTAGMRKALGPLEQAAESFAEALFEARQQLLALDVRHKTHALHAFAQAFLHRYEAEKARLNVLDFEDLLLRTKGLLSDPGVADWVLYRLDGGIEHVLVDEAQDTSPLQWEIIDLLTRELTAGEGQRGSGERTIFVVGDKKQSIYSFQGAEPEGFDRMQADFAARLQGVQAPLQAAQLTHSFRSAPAILRAVDHTFAGGGLPGVPADLSHRAFHEALPGRVDLWPAVPKSEGEDDRPWDDPVDIPSSRHHDVLLAEQIASEIARMIGKEVLWDRDNGGYQARRLRPRDFLILVQRRSLLFHEIIRACKAKGLPLAGADRLKIGGELAVKDLTALLSFLATPEDSLSLASILRSPLFGWSEGDLYDLAAGRPEEHLWPALRNRGEDFPKTLAMLQGLLDQVDFLRPYDLLSHILVALNGRRNLIARLGSEAEEGVDALLSQALAYEVTEVPSLTGFLAWLEADETEIRRQIDATSDEIRVMTVHGAKGLEAPIVIVPDAGKRREDIRDAFLLNGPTPLWKPASDARPAALDDLVSDATSKIREERARLLYVAMTRAEQWLIVCAAGDLGQPAQSWHSQVEAGLRAADAKTHTFPFGDGLRLEDWRTAVQPEKEHTKTQEDTPGHQKTLETQADRPLAKDKPLSPSDLGGAKALPGETDPWGLARGTLLHRLLEVLPGVPDTSQETVARDLAELLAPGLPNGDAVLATAQQLLGDPNLSAVFDPSSLSEVEVTGTLFGRPCKGAIDRLLIEDARVRAIDFKSNAIVPEQAKDTPEGILRQMGAYAELLSQVFPDRRVETAILWTQPGELMSLPHGLVTSALQRASTLDPAVPNT